MFKREHLEFMKNEFKTHSFFLVVDFNLFDKKTQPNFCGSFSFRVLIGQNQMVVSKGNRQRRVTTFF